MLIPQLDSYHRERLSPSARALLCDFASGDLERPLSRLEADWGEVFRGLYRNGLLGLADRYLKHGVDRDDPPPDFTRRVHHMHRLDAIRMAVTYRNVGWVLDGLAESGADHMVVKGPVAAHMIYPHPSLRGFNDLDLIVRERDWSQIHQALLRMGFQPEVDLPHPPPKLVPQAAIYEMPYWHPDKEFLVEVHYEDLLNAGLVSRDVEGFWQRAVWVEAAGKRIKTLSLEDQLIHLCAHAHYHCYTRLTWFSDTAFIVRDHGADLDWEGMLEAVRLEEAQVPVYYSLYFVERLLGVSVPEKVMAELLPDPFRRRWHERYLPEEEVLSLHPMARPDFSFYFIPLFKRMLPDLLVMGRRGDKLHYLRRLLLPPGTWLRSYYQLGNTRKLWIHYLLHPLKLLYHYLRELAVAVSQRHELGVP